MSFLKKLFGKPDQDKQKQQPAVEQSDEKALSSNSSQLEEAGLEKEDKKGSWLSRAFGGLKNAGKAMGNGAKNGGIMGGGIGALPGGLVGAGVGASAGAMIGGTMDGKDGAKAGAGMGAKGLGALLALPGALVGGAIGALAGMGKGLTDELTYDEEELLKQTADIPGYHVILEQLAHTYAYGKGDMKTLEAWGYELAAEHEDKNSGFRVVAFKPQSDGALDPDGKPLKPVVAFRGTANGGGALDDINDQGIGTYQFSRNEKETEQTIQAAKGTAAPDVTGHSLGGALAQLAAARFGGMVGNIVTFQSAGINGAEAQRIDSEEHKATHYRTGGDLVHSGGEAFANGNVVQFNTKGIDTALSHMTFPLAELNALRGKNDTDAPHVDGARGKQDEWVIDKKGDYHNGHWKDEEAQTESNLHRVEKTDSVHDASESGIVEMIGGRKNAGKTMGLAAKTGVAETQQVYAKAWREIRGVCMNIQTEADIPKVRDMVIDMCIKHAVEAQDHAKFVSQAEAAMLDALDMKQMQGAAQN